MHNYQNGMKNILKIEIFPKDQQPLMHFKLIIFERLNLSRASVMDNGKLVGVVSLTRMGLHGIRK